MNKIFLPALAMGALLFAFGASAETEFDHKFDKAARKTNHALNKAGRKIKDETCELVDGKMSCAEKKLKHRAQNAADKAEDSIKE